MALRGQTKNVALLPTLGANTDPAETFVPTQTQLFNGRMTDTGAWAKRPGFSRKWDTGATRAIEALIPDGAGYAVNSQGTVYKLSTATPTALTGSVSTTFRPQWGNHDGATLVASGGTLKQVASTGVTDVAGSPPGGAKFIAMLNTRVFLAGHKDTELFWSDAGSHVLWTSTNFTNVEGNGEKIRGISSFNGRLYIFKSRSLEVWNNVGGQTVVTRSAFVDVGSGADYSLVQANNTHYWYGHDGDFYALNGITPQVISGSIRRELDRLKTTSDCYGFDFRTENVVRWYFPTEGRTFVYDYRKNFFSEDGSWAGGQFGRMPIKSHMEFGDKAYVGDYNPTGLIYEWRDEDLDDAGSEIRVHRRFNVRLDESGRRARVGRIQFRVKRGVATDDEKTPEFMLRYRFDRGQWVDWRNYSLGEKGDYDAYIDLYNIGTGREAEFELTETDAVSWLVTDMNINTRALGR